MPIYSFHSPRWKRVKNSKTINRKCPRCNNTVDFILVYDEEGMGLFEYIFIKTKTHYALHCPICIYYEAIDKCSAKEIMNDL